MQNRLSILLLFFSIAFIWLSPANALACACCAEPGTYYLATYKPRDFELNLLKEFEFGDKANLYTTEAGLDIIQGLDDLKAEFESEASGSDYNLFGFNGSFTGRQWRFQMISPGKKKGELTLPLPSKMAVYKVDIHDQVNPPLGPRLYKEFRFEGQVTAASGLFRSSLARATKYSLIFQGRGLGCDEVSDFTHWRLEINGPRSGYAFFGKLASAGKVTE